MTTRPDLFIANLMRDVVNEALARYDVHSDVYESDVLIDAACVCLADKVITHIKDSVDDYPRMAKRPATYGE